MTSPDPSLHPSSALGGDSGDPALSDLILFFFLKKKKIHLLPSILPKHSEDQLLLVVPERRPLLWPSQQLNLNSAVNLRSAQSRPPLYPHLFSVTFDPAIANQVFNLVLCTCDYSFLNARFSFLFFHSNFFFPLLLHFTYFHLCFGFKCSRATLAQTRLSTQNV